MTLENIQQFTSVRIQIAGHLLKPVNLCCQYATIIAGLILLLPFLFMGCDWWKRRAYSVYYVENVGYDALIELLHKATRVS